MAGFPTIVLISKTGPGRIEGELVLKTQVNWQVAVAGTVIVISKEDYYEQPAYRGDFADLFNGWVR